MNTKKSVRIDISTKVISPLFFIPLAWGLVVCCYSLNWSKLLIPLSFELVFFIVATIIISIILLKYTPVLKFAFEIDVVSMNKKIKMALLICFLLFAIESVACGGFPLLFLLRGTFQYGDFGLPFVHVIWYCLSSIYCSISWLLFVALKEKKYFLYSFFFLVPGILIITRSFLLYNFLYCFIIWYSFKKYNIKTLIKPLPKILFLVLIIFMLFGRIGEVRSSSMPDLNEEANSYIEQIAAPTDNFKKTKLPSVLLWAYCYIATPLSNLQNTINLQPNPKIDQQSMFTLLNHFLPEMIGKRISFIFKTSKNVRANLVVPYMNQSSVYMDAYLQLGWFGLLHSAIFSFVLILIIYKCKKKNNMYSYLSFIYFSVIVILNVFSNMYHFMGVSPQFWIAFFINLIDFEKLSKIIFRINYSGGRKNDICMYSNI